MQKIIIYGSAQIGIQIAWHTSFDSEILGFVDSDAKKHQNGKGVVEIDGKKYPIFSPTMLKNMEFDKIYIATEIPLFISQIKQTLSELGIEESKIDLSLTFIPYYSRLNFIKTISYKLASLDMGGGGSLLA